jgi:phosphate-selective porin OprO/OprP
MKVSNFASSCQRALRGRLRRLFAASRVGVTFGVVLAASGLVASGHTGTALKGAGFISAGFIGGKSANAEEPRLSLSHLESRIEALERQNQQLRESLLDRLPSNGRESAPMPATDSVLVNPPGLDLTRFSELMEAYRAEEAARAGAVGVGMGMGMGMGELSATSMTEAGKDKGASDPSSGGYEVGSETSMTASWKNGLEFSTKNKDFRVHIGGRTQVDSGWFNVDSNVYDNAAGFAQPTPGLGNVYGDGVDFRRARLRIDGTMYEQIEWAAEYDFVNSAVLGGSSRSLGAPTDLWWAFKDVPGLGLVKIGNQKEPIGFEHIVSSRFLPFMERSYNQDTFYGGAFNGFNPGITASGMMGEDSIGTYSVGIFKPTNNVFGYNTGDGDYSVTGRLTRLLWVTEDSRRLVHVGGSLRQATAVATNVGAGSSSRFRSQTFRTRDAIRTGLSGNWPTPANITLFGDDEQTANVELAAVYGSWTFQAEYLVNALQDARLTGGGPIGTTAVYHGGYVQLLYFLTGESDEYDRQRGSFDRVHPNENFFLLKDANGQSCYGSGAWQVGARYNYLDLNDEGLNGGILHNGTFGLNCFLNPNMKIQFNYMLTYRDAPLAGGVGDGMIHGWGMRLAHDF